MQPLAPLFARAFNRTLTPRRRVGLGRDRRAVVAIIFALAALPIVGLVGLAIDFGFATQAKSQLALAADTAALQATTTAANAFNAGQTNYVAQGIAAGQQWFQIQAGTVLNTTVQYPATVTVTQTGATFNATLTYQVTVSTYFGRFFGITNFTESGTSKAVITSNAYVNVTFLLDNSSSMTIASTQAGITALNLLTQGFTPASTVPNGLAGYPCAFACHWDNTGSASNPVDFYGVARKAGIQLRLDVLQSATSQAVGLMITKELITNQFGAGVYTFNSSLTQVFPVGTNQTTSPDLASALVAVQAMKTPVTNDTGSGAGFNGTNFAGSTGAMAQLTALMPAAGDGSTPAKAQQSLIIVTDGMQDFGDRSIPGQEGPMTPINCAAVKAKGVAVYVLYTTYNADSSVLLFGNSALAPYLAGTASPGMVASLQSCASSTAAFAQASDPTAITTAMNAMLQAALRSGGRFTQ